MCVCTNETINPIKNVTFVGLYLSVPIGVARLMASSAQSLGLTKQEGNWGNPHHVGP